MANRADRLEATLPARQKIEKQLGAALRPLGKVVLPKHKQLGDSTVLVKSAGGSSIIVGVIAETNNARLVSLTTLTGKYRVTVSGVRNERGRIICRARYFERLPEEISPKEMTKIVAAVQKALDVADAVTRKCEEENAAWVKRQKAEEDALESFKVLCTKLGLPAPTVDDGGSYSMIGNMTVLCSAVDGYELRLRYLTETQLTMAIKNVRANLKVN